MEISLVNRVQTQDQTVIGQLYNDYGGALFGVVYRIVGERDVAEQVLQDTFVKIWRNGPKYNETKGRLYTWMLNIARNTAIDAVRSSGYRNTKLNTDMDKVGAAMVADTVDPHLMDIKGIVDKLDEKYRTIVQKIYFEGYTHSDLADELDIPIGTIKTRLRYAMQDLRGMMGHNSTEVMMLIMLLSQSH
jgi:RNA polymerase sigma factor (sigma-70 family)